MPRSEDESVDAAAERMTAQRLVDFRTAATIGKRLAPRGPRVDFAEAADTVAQIRECSVDAGALVAAVTGLDTRPGGSGRHPAAEVVDRGGWIDMNVASFEVILTPLLEAMERERHKVGPGPAVGAISSVGRVTAGLELGALLAYLSGRVLGQFEALANDPGRLVVVAPNVVAFERETEVVPRDFRLWVAVHEVTHRTQFGQAPWLRGHLLDGMSELMGGTDMTAAGMRRRLSAGIGEVFAAIREQRPLPSLVDIAQSPAQRALLDRLTATMSLLEGHAEYVMNAVGTDAIGTLPDIRARFERRRSSGGSLGRMIKQLLGFEAKLRQYGDGSRFVSAVVDRAGMTTLNRAWQGPQSLPSLSELHDPDAWLDRVG